MPLFEYRCKDCGQVTEVLERPGSPKSHRCPKCGSARMRKQLSAFGVGKTHAASSAACPTGTCPLPH